MPSYKINVSFNRIEQYSLLYKNLFEVTKIDDNVIETLLETHLRS